MNDHRIRADSFVIKGSRKRIFRVRQRGSGTLYWTSAKQVVNYLTELQARRLKAKQGK